MKKKSQSFQYFALILFCLILLSGCSQYYAEPNCKGETSLNPEAPWNPKPKQWPCVQDPSCRDRDQLTIPEENNPLTISELIDIALRNNPKTQRSWYDARAAAFNMWASKSILYPTVSVLEDLTYEDNSRGGAIGAGTSTGTVGTQALQAASGTGVTQGGVGSFAPGKTKTVTSDLAVSYLLLDFGGRSATIAVAKQALYASNWSHNRTLQAVMLSVLQNYYNYISTKELLKAQEDDLKNSETSLEASKQLFEAGIVTRVDVLQAQSNLINSQLAVVSTQGQIEVAFGNLATSIGLPPNTPFEVQKLPEKIPFEEVGHDVDGLMELAKTQRPDLASAYAQYLQSKANYCEVVSSSLPTLSAFVNLQEVNFLEFTKFNGHAYTGTLELSIPIFNGFLHRNEIRKAKAEIESSTANLLDVEAAVLLDVSTSYYNYLTAVKTMSYSEEYLKYATDAYNLALATYKEGTGTILDVLAAQKTLSAARAQKIQAITEWAISLSNIAYSTGTLYQEAIP